MLKSSLFRIVDPHTLVQKPECDEVKKVDKSKSFQKHLSPKHRKNVGFFGGGGRNKQSGGYGCVQNEPQTHVKKRKAAQLPSFNDSNLK